MAHAVVRTDLMHGTDVRGELVSLVYANISNNGGTQTVTPREIDNGNVLLISDLLEGERELRYGVTPAANSDLRDIALVATPEVMYDERKKNLDEFYNEAGRTARGYRLHSGDIFSVTADALAAAGTIAVGNIVELQAGTKMKVVSTLTNGSTQIGKIIAIDVVGRYTYYVIEV